MVRQSSLKTPRQNFSKKHTQEFLVTKTIGLLDFLLLNMKQSRNNTKMLLTKKKVLVDGVVVSQYDYVLQPKQMVSLSAIPVRQESLAKELDIIFEDAYLIAINKPSGLLTIGSDREKEKTAYRMLSDYVAQQDKKNRVYITHRLDRDTSGVLIILKDEKLRDEMQDDWNNQIVTRKYTAIVEGRLANQSGMVRSWLRETRTNIMYSSARPSDGQEAITHYRVLKQSSYYTLVDVKIDSGRKNQIRVHMLDLGHPVIGDDKYGSPSNPLKRLGLHASLLEFYHPVSKQLMKVEAKLPKEFNKLFK